MTLGEETSAEYLDRVLGVLPMTVAAVDEQSRIIWANKTAARMAPVLLESETIRDALADLAHDQKIDRLLIRHEVVTCPGWPGGPDLHWMVWTEPLTEGEWILMVWEADWSEEMNERRTAFTMAASHELRTPLTALLGFAELLEADAENLRPSQIEAVRTIAETARHLAKLVEDIFELTSNSFGELRLHLEEVDLGPILRNIVDALGPEAESRDDILTLTVEPELPAIEVDPARVRQMLANLIRNAIVHNPTGTEIKVDLRRVRGEIGISVTDDGRGLPFSDPEEAFSSFNRGGATVGDRAGAGIGLTITKRLIQLHRGSIEVMSRSGEGSTFTLWFPIDRASALSPDQPGPA